MKKIVFVFVAVLAIICLAGYFRPVPVYAQGAGNCLDSSNPNWIKEDSGGTSVTINADPGFVINSVTVKAGSEASTGGNECITLTGSNSCYSVSGLGTGSVTVTKVGDGPSCKDISHLEAIQEQVPTDEPTQEPTDEPTSEPTEEPTEVPTEEPTSEPTEEPTQEPSETPDPSETPNPTDTPEPFGTPVGTTAAILIPVTGVDQEVPLFFPALGIVGIGLILNGLRLKLKNKQ